MNPLEAFLAEQAGLVQRWLLNPAVPATVAVLVLASLWRPGVRDEDEGRPRLGAALLDDALFGVLSALVYTPVVFGLLWFQSRWAGALGPSADALASWPVAAQVLLVLVVGDAVAWLSHRLRHAGPLWNLHRTHHAPRRLTPLTTKRVHPLDLLADLVVSRGLVLVLLPVSLDAWPLVFLVDAAWDYWIHSEWRVSLGPLDRWLVTPGYHRLHHSRRPEHRDKNFADRFTVWDRLAGTARFDFDAAQLGIDDAPDPAPEAGPLRRHWHALRLPFIRAAGGVPAARPADPRAASSAPGRTARA